MTGSRAHIAAAQLAGLRELLAAIEPDNRFYSHKLRAAGIGGDLDSLEDFVRRMPFTTKQELSEDQLAHPPYGTNLTYPLERYRRFCQTSGTSTGVPLRWLDTEASWSWMLHNWSHVFKAAGVTYRDSLFFAFSFGPFLGFWSAFEAAERLGCLCIPGGGMRSVTRLRTMIDTGVTVLCCTPTYAMHLAEASLEAHIDLAASKVMKIIVAGEPGGSIPATREHISALWHGARVIDHHGMTEIGPVSYTCPARPDTIHIIETAFIAEVIDPNTCAPVACGTTGELVLTNLGRLGSPLLRYRTGDVVRASADEVCACGSAEMALDGGILARTDDMLVVRGVNLYPGAVDNIVRSTPGVAEYRVSTYNRHSLLELGIEIELRPDYADGSGLVHRLEVALTDTFAMRIPVTVAAPGALPRFEMKANRWVRHA